jgi:hypothetical protein
MDAQFGIGGPFRRQGFGDQLVGGLRAIGLASRAIDSEGHPAFERLDFEGILGAAGALYLNVHCT